MFEDIATTYNDNPVKQLFDDIENSLNSENYTAIRIITKSETYFIPVEDAGRISYENNNYHSFKIQMKKSLKYIPLNNVLEVQLIA